MNRSENYAELVNLARAWLQGWLVEDADGLMASRRATVGAREDKDGRRALAQLLVDGDPPQEILDLLAVLFSPDATAQSPIIGEHLYKTGDKTIYLQLDGSGWTLPLPKRRDNVRMRDPVFVGSVLLAMRDKIQAGMTVEDACAAISDALAERGFTSGTSDRNIKAIWDQYSAVRHLMFE